MLDKNLMLDILMLDINVNRARSMRMRLRKRLNAWSASMLELRAALTLIASGWVGGGRGEVNEEENAEKRRKTQQSRKIGRTPSHLVQQLLVLVLVLGLDWCPRLFHCLHTGRDDGNL